MNYIKTRYTIDRLISEGQGHLKLEDDQKHFPEILNWVRTSEDLLRTQLPEKSALIDEVKKQRKEDTKINVNSVIYALEGAREILKAKNSECERNSLKEEIRLIINDRSLQSWWVRIQAIIVVALIVFAIIGVFQIGDYKFNFKQEIEKQLANVKSEASEALQNIRLLNSKAERGINAAISKAASVSLSLKNQTEEAEDDLNNIESKINTLDEELEKRVSQAEEKVLLQAQENAAQKISDNFSIFVKDERSRIKREVDIHISNLKHDIAPEIGKSMGELLELVGILKNRADNIQSTIKELEKSVIPAVEKVAQLEKDLVNLKESIDKFDSYKVSGIVKELEPSIKKATAVSQWFWVSIFLSGVTILGLIAMGYSLWRVRRQISG